MFLPVRFGSSQLLKAVMDSGTAGTPIQERMEVDLPGYTGSVMQKQHNYITDRE
ncbi:MAG: hypothetical protein LUC83_10530 [Clostridiales bacterium]|nr:hypothetical protein [Clostridiales bacterium]